MTRESLPPENRNVDSTDAPSLPDLVHLPADWNELNVAVALSGGGDSVALLRVLEGLKRQAAGSGQLLALHVNHQLRGADSNADSHWCRELCDSLKVPLQVLSCDTAQLASDQGDGIEAAARAQRYQLLSTAAEKAGVRYLVTAHTRDDQIETILFRILRGTGLRGLAAIPRNRALTPSLTLLRPLLACSREQIMDYLEQLNQEYRTDLTNTDRRFTRNRLRHDLLPELRSVYNDRLDAALLRLSKQAGEAQQFVEDQARLLLDTARKDAKPQAIELDCSALAKCEPLLVRESLRIAWRDAGLAEQAMTFDWWDQLAEVTLAARDGTVLNLPGNVRASIAGGALRLEW